MTLKHSPYVRSTCYHPVLQIWGPLLNFIFPIIYHRYLTNNTLYAWSLNICKLYCRSDLWTQVALKANSTVVEENTVCNVMAGSEYGDIMIFQNILSASKTTKCHRDEAPLTTSSNFSQIFIKCIIWIMKLLAPILISINF